MPISPGPSDSSRLSRRQLLQAGGLALGALAVGRPAAAQAPRPGGSLISAQATEATGLDPQLGPALAHSRRSPLTYNQLVRFDDQTPPTPVLSESWEARKHGRTWTFKLRPVADIQDAHV